MFTSFSVSVFPISGENCGYSYSGGQPEILVMILSKKSLAAGLCEMFAANHFAEKNLGYRF